MHHQCFIAPSSKVQLINAIHCRLLVDVLPPLQNKTVTLLYKYILEGRFYFVTEEVLLLHMVPFTTFRFNSHDFSQSTFFRNLDFSKNLL